MKSGKFKKKCEDFSLKTPTFLIPKEFLGNISSLYSIISNS
jgi:hypothetical protein